MMNDAMMPETSCDDWYGGRLRLTQPVGGFRANLDAILLAAAVPDHAQYVLELGAGAGGAALALAARVPDISILAVEHDEVMGELLAQNIAQNDRGHHVKAMRADALMAKPGWAGRHDVVMVNPPYNDAKSTLSSDQYRQDAMAEDDLARWINAAATGLAAKGRLVMICRADRLDDVMAGLAHNFGEVTVKAVHTQADKPAKRVLVSARKEVDGPVGLLPALITQDDHGIETEEMAVISMGGGGIDMTLPGRKLAKIRLPDF